MINKTLNISARIVLLCLPLLWSCDKQDIPDKGGQSVPEGMVEVRPALPGMFSSIPRDASEVHSATTRAYDNNTITNEKLDKTIRLPEGSTVWLIAKNSNDKTLVKNSYVVYNSGETDARSYLVPCKVDDTGSMTSMEGTPLYLKEGTTYLFYAVSPARKLDEELFTQGNVRFQVKNGMYFYANDCRYDKTTPKAITIENKNTEAVQEIPLNPMINQTAELKFRISKGNGVHDLDIQPSGIQISGLQNDSPEANADGTPTPYGDSDGLYWHMSQNKNDEPITLQHGDKAGIYNCYDYMTNTEGNVNIEVSVLPMWSLSKPVIVVFRLKVNGVPTSYEMMLNEKDFKAGYSYGYRGEVSIRNGVEVITWQYVSWEYEVDFPFNSTDNNTEK